MILRTICLLAPVFSFIAGASPYMIFLDHINSDGQAKDSGVSRPCRAAFAPIDKSWMAVSLEAEDARNVTENIIKTESIDERNIYAQYSPPKTDRLRKQGSLWHGMKLVYPKTGDIFGYVEIDSMGRADFEAGKGPSLVLENYVPMGVMTSGHEEDAPLPSLYKKPSSMPDLTTLHGKYRPISGKRLAHMRVFLNSEFAPDMMLPTKEVAKVAPIIDGIMNYLLYLSDAGHPLHPYPTDPEEGPVHAIMTYTSVHGTSWEGAFRKSGFTDVGINQEGTPGYWPPESRSKVSRMRTMYCALEGMAKKVEADNEPLKEMLEKYDALNT